MNPTNMPDNMRRKQTEAKKRQADWVLMSPEEKLRALDLRPGASKRERTRIMRHIEMVKATKDAARTPHNPKT